MIACVSSRTWANDEKINNEEGRKNKESKKKLANKNTYLNNQNKFKA